MKNSEIRDEQPRIEKFSVSSEAKSTTFQHGDRKIVEQWKIQRNLRLQYGKACCEVRFTMGELINADKRRKEQ